MKKVLSVLLALCLLVGVVPVFATAAPSTEQYMRQVFELVNKERAKAGVAPLGSNSKLNELANIRAKELVTKFDHTRPDGRDCFTIFYDNGIGGAWGGENIAAGYNTPTVVMNSWMNSSSHQENILNADYQLVGIGYCQIPGSKYGTYWVQLFYGGDELQADPFWDVPAGENSKFFTKPVLWAVEKGVTYGKDSATTFKPDDKCTRAEIVTFLWRALGKPSAPDTNRFTDMPKNVPDFVRAINWAVANGVTDGKGSASTFKPNDTCTRAEAVTFLWRALGKLDAPAANRFTDMPTKVPDFVKAINWAVANGITDGKGSATTFKPNDKCSRAEIVTFLYRAME